MPTRNELRLQDDVHRIADSLESIALILEGSLVKRGPLPEPGSLPKLPQDAFNTERGPGHRE